MRARGPRAARTHSLPPSTARGRRARAYPAGIQVSKVDCPSQATWAEEGATVVGSCGDLGPGPLTVVGAEGGRRHWGGGYASHL